MLFTRKIMAQIIKCGGAIRYECYDIREEKDATNSTFRSIK